MNKFNTVLGLGVLGFSLSMGAAQAQMLERSIQTEDVARTETSSSSTVLITPTDNDSNLLAQRRDRSGAISPTEKYSYIGVGGNIGLSDADTGTGETGFAVMSKVAITNNISVRPSVVIGSDTAITVPVTYDFSVRNSNISSSITPYVGGGVVFATGGGDDTDLMVTSGVDYRFKSNWVGNASINVGFGDDRTDVGLMLGVGYVFPHSK